MTTFLLASIGALWIAVIALGVVCIALARQVGLLHERIAPAGALMLKQANGLRVGDAAPRMMLQTLSGNVVHVGQPASGRGQMLFFLSPACPLCKALLPTLTSIARAEEDWLDLILASDGEQAEHETFTREHGLARFPYVVSEALGKAFAVSKLPHATLIAPDGKVASMGLVNSREHLESLFEAHTHGVASLQEYLDRRAHRHDRQGNQHEIT